MDMHMGLLLVSGVFWTVTYALIIKRGFQEKTFGMPLVALCANISWEFVFGFLWQHPVPYRYTNMVWFAFDAVILFQTVRSWRNEFPDLSSRTFYPMFLVSLATAFCLVLLVSLEFGDWRGAYTAFGQNLMMSIMFITMLHRRNSPRGQSIYIAAFKMIGTLLASLAFGAYPPGEMFVVSPLFPFLYISTLVFDAVYIVMVYRRCQEQGINPWKRL
jgi:hypothetical protein